MSSNKNYIIRLSAYRNAILRLKTMGFVKVFAENLADSAGIASSQVRKDFSIFGIVGNKKGGYIIDELLEQLNEILGKNKVNNVVVVGIGNIGKALMRYKGFEEEGIRILAGFDIEPSKINEKDSIPIHPIENLKEFIKKNHISIGIIAVPDTVAQQILDLLISFGIKGILNFAPIRLKAPENIVINNVDLRIELETVIYYVSAMSKQNLKNRKGEILA